MRLSLRATQRVVMTPLLQQAIQLLQLSTLELEQVVRKELEENPLLEELPEEKQEVDGEAATATAADGTELAPAPAPTEPPSKETSSVDGERADDLPFDLTSAVFDQQDERTPVSTEEREYLPFENLLTLRAVGEDIGSAASPPTSTWRRPGGCSSSSTSSTAASPRTHGPRA